MNPKYKIPFSIIKFTQSPFFWGFFIPLHPLPSFSSFAWNLFIHPHFRPPSKTLFQEVLTLVVETNRTNKTTLLHYLPPTVYNCPHPINAQHFPCAGPKICHAASGLRGRACPELVAGFGSDFLELWLLWFKPKWQKTIQSFPLVFLTFRNTSQIALSSSLKTLDRHGKIFILIKTSKLAPYAILFFLYLPSQADVKPILPQKHSINLTKVIINLMKVIINLTKVIINLIKVLKKFTKVIINLIKVLINLTEAVINSKYFSLI